MTNACRISTRKAGAVFLSGAVALLVLTGGALAQATTSQMDGLKLSSDEPIQIESDKLEIHDKEHTADFTGNVKVVQGKTTLQAGHMTDEPLLLFRSPGKEQLNIVYRRHDGNIGWIDAASIKS